MKKSNPYILVVGLFVLFEDTRAWICTPRPLKDRHFVMKDASVVHTKDSVEKFNWNKQSSNESRLHESIIPLTDTSKEDSVSK